MLVFKHTWQCIFIFKASIPALWSKVWLNKNDKTLPPKNICAFGLIISTSLISLVVKNFFLIFVYSECGLFELNVYQYALILYSTYAQYRLTTRKVYNPSVTEKSHFPLRKGKQSNINQIRKIKLKDFVIFYHQDLAQFDFYTQRE